MRQDYQPSTWLEASTKHAEIVAGSAFLPLEVYFTWFTRETCLGNWNKPARATKFPPTVQLYAVRGELTESTLIQHNLLRKDAVTLVCLFQRSCEVRKSGVALLLCTTRQRLGLYQNSLVVVLLSHDLGSLDARHSRVDDCRAKSGSKTVVFAR